MAGSQNTVQHTQFRSPRKSSPVTHELHDIDVGDSTDDTASIGSLDSNCEGKTSTSAPAGLTGRGQGSRALTSRFKLFCKTELISTQIEPHSFGLKGRETRSSTYASESVKVFSKKAKIESDTFQDPCMNLSYTNLQPLNELSCLARACNLCLGRTLVDHEEIASIYAEKMGGTRFEGSSIEALTSYCSRKRPDILITNQAGKMNWLVGKRGHKAGGAYLASVTVDYTDFGSGKGFHFVAAFPGNRILRDPNFPEVLVLSKASLKALKVVKLHRLWRVRVRRPQ
jgi:hypothetical protein